MSPLLTDACMLLPQGPNSVLAPTAVREEQLLMERHASQNHLEAFSLDTTDTSSPPKTGTMLQKLHRILQRTHLCTSRNNEKKSVLMCSSVKLFIVDSSY